MNLNPLFFNKQSGNDSLKLLGLNQAVSQTYLFSDIIKVCEDELDGGANVKLKSSITDLIPNLNNLELSAPAESKLTFVIEKVIDSLDVNGVEIKSDLFKLDKANITHSEMVFNGEELKTFLNELNSLLQDVPEIANVKTETINKYSEKENDDEKTDDEILSPDSIINILQNNDSIKLILKTEGEKLTFVFSKTEQNSAADIETISDLSADALFGSDETNTGTESNLTMLQQQSQIPANGGKENKSTAGNEFYKIEIVHTALEPEETSTNRPGKLPFLFNARSLKVINDFLAKYASDTKNAEDSTNQNIIAGTNSNTADKTAGANVVAIKNSMPLNLQNSKTDTPFEPILNDDQEEQISILSNRPSQTFNESSDLKRKLVFINSAVKVEGENGAAQTKLVSANLVGNENELGQNYSAGTIAAKNNVQPDEQSQKEVFMFNTQRSMKDLLSNSEAPAKNKINDTAQQNISTATGGISVNNFEGSNLKIVKEVSASTEPTKNNRLDKKENKNEQKISVNKTASAEEQSIEQAVPSKENVNHNHASNDAGSFQNQSNAKQTSSHVNSESQSSQSVSSVNESISKADQSKDHTKNFVSEIGSNTEHKINHTVINKTKAMDDLSSFNETLKVIKTDELAAEINKYLQSNGKQSITFQLTPENLGKVKLMVDYADNQLQASIEVENEQVKQHVQSNIDQLKNNLQSSGVQINNINVSISSNEQKNHKHAVQKKKTFADPEEIKVNENKSSSETQKKMGYNTYEYLA